MARHTEQRERSIQESGRVEIPITLTWPEMRIIRQANTEPDAYNTEAWHRFLDDLGHRNYGKGNAKSLGSLAIVYVPARDMGRMLQQKYPNVYQNRAKTIKLQRSIAETIRLFVRDSYGAAYDAETDNMELNNFRIRAATAGFSMSNELEEPLSYEVPAGRLLYTDDDHEDLVASDPEKPGRPGKSPVAFSDTRLRVRGMELYGKDGFGINLTSNQILYDERSAFMNFLRQEERLDTRGLNQDWAAHATVFTYEQHINSTIIRHKLGVPSPIMFDAPRAHVS